MAERGFTLVELMVVLAILGTLAGAVMLALPDPSGGLGAEAERFAARARAARDAAIVAGRPRSLAWDARGYRIEERLEGEWAEMARHAWADGTRGPEPARTLFDPTGLADPALVALARGDRRIAVSIGGDGAIDVRR